MIGILDNYDSFTYNLVQRVGELNTGLGISVWRNDRVTIDELRAAGITHLIVSPGPGTPDGAGISMKVMSVAGRRIKKVRVTKVASEEGEEAPDSNGR